MEQMDEALARLWLQHRERLVAGDVDVTAAVDRELERCVAIGEPHAGPAFRAAPRFGVAPCDRVTQDQHDQRSARLAEVGAVRGRARIWMRRDEAGDRRRYLAGL